MFKKIICITSICLLTACGGGSASTVAPATFSITSSSYADNGVIPNANACVAQGGSNQSPQLSLANLPIDTAKLAIVMDDEVSPCGTGADACVHWAVFNLPSTKTTIAASEDLSTVAGKTYGQTYDGASIGYAGPCPPSNHVYKLTVFALKSSVPTITQGAQLTRSTFASTYASHITAQATWTGKFPH